jgi:hypothetical protein
MHHNQRKSKKAKRAGEFQVLGGAGAVVAPVDQQTHTTVKLETFELAAS